MSRRRLSTGSSPAGGLASRRTTWKTNRQRLAPAGPRPDIVPHSISQYDGGIAYADAQIGKVVEWLKQYNAYDNTMIVVTSDHGEAFGERNHIGHANSAYQNLLHVPLLIKYPHGGHRGAESHPVSLIDVAPTILSTLGVPVPQTMQGRNLTGAGASEPRPIFSETFPCPVMHPQRSAPTAARREPYFSLALQIHRDQQWQAGAFRCRSGPG